jgi:hypothetical protein
VGCRSRWARRHVCETREQGVSGAKRESARRLRRLLGEPGIAVSSGSRPMRSLQTGCTVHTRCNMNILILEPCQCNPSHDCPVRVMAVSDVEAPILVEPPKTARIAASTMTANAIDSLSELSVRSINPDLERSFYRRFPKTRESYDRRKEQEVITMISQSKGWKCVGKPCFRRDASTGIVFRKAPPRRQHLTRHITACVPYELSFNVAVSHETSAFRRLNMTNS